MYRVACAVLFALPALSFAEDDPKKVAEALKGEWKIVSFNKGGDELPKKELEGAKIVVAGEKMTISLGKKDEPATFKLDAKAVPPAIDIIPGKGGKQIIVKGIYKLEKDTLTICFGPDESPRPGEFKAGKMASIIVLEKVKK
jgi:uncharacterized protein (TIGR03067 family)